MALDLFQCRVVGRARRRLQERIVAVDGEQVLLLIRWPGQPQLHVLIHGIAHAKRERPHASEVCVRGRPLHRVAHQPLGQVQRLRREKLLDALRRVGRIGKAKV